MDREGQPGETEPDPRAEVDHEALEEELVCAAVEEVEEPLLGRVRAVVPDVPAAVALLRVVVVLAVPGLVHHLGHAQTLAVGQSHVLGVAELVVSQAASYNISRELRTPWR